MVSLSLWCCTVCQASDTLVFFSLWPRICLVSREAGKDSIILRDHQFTRSKIASCPVNSNNPGTTFPLAMNLVVDIGNSRMKAGLFEGPVLQEQRWPKDNRALQRLMEGRSVKAIIISSVAALTHDGPSPARQDIPYIMLTPRTPLPFANVYPTLGADRIAAVAGAQSYYPQQPVLVIDVGSCITYDFIDQQAYYQGGLISPGIRMRLRAMHTFTARLPLVELGDPEPLNLMARNTPDSLRGGAVQGAVAEISQMIRMYTDKFSDLHVVVCGGDVSYFSSLQQDHAVTIVPELILIGLNCILQYNVDQKN